MKKVIKLNPPGVEVGISYAFMSGRKRMYKHRKPRFPENVQKEKMDSPAAGDLRK